MVVEPKDPTARGAAQVRQVEGVEMDLGTRVGGLPPRVVARLHAPVSWEGPAPLVLWLPDAGFGPDDYFDSGNHLASHGFVVLAPGYDGGLQVRGDAGLREDVLATLAWLRSSPLPVEDVAVDVRSVGVVGHGRGGEIALSVAGEPRVGAALALDPDGAPPPRDDGTGDIALTADGLADAPAPIGLLGAGRSYDARGCVTPASGFPGMLELAPSGTVAFEVPSAGHLDLVDACASGKAGVDCDACQPGDDPAVSARFARATATAFLATHLLGDAGYAGWMEGDQSAALVPEATRVVVAR